jgi:aldose 1-epimerase
MRCFGVLEDGRSVESIVLGEPRGLQAEILTYGAILRRLSVPTASGRRDLVLHLGTLEDYVRDRAYVGALVGRFGNRIAGSEFAMDGERFRLTANEGGNHLHGGALGFGKRLWRILDWQSTAAARLRLGYRSSAGEEGYPGNLQATAAFEIEGSSLRIDLTATTDAPTAVNLTYHPYFNLSGDFSAPAGAQQLRIPASHFLPVADSGLIPTGELAPVAATPFDFRSMRPLDAPPATSHAQLALAGGYDHCWALDRGADCAAELHSPQSGITLSLLGSGPGVQFYGGQYLARTHPTLGHGVILEPQGFPNAVNEPRFPSAILRPGAAWRATIEYRIRY